jgi:hypothetical protein
MSDEASTCAARSKPLCLSNMSSMILSVLKSRDHTSFQEVADAVVSGIGDPIDTDNERTVRRRVYDVLNVFMAAGFIERDSQTRAIAVTLNHNQGESAVDMHQKVVKSKRVQLADKVRMFIGWRLLMQRNMKRTPPDRPIPLLHTLFIGFARYGGAGSSSQAVDRRTVALHAESSPIFFSPMELVTKLGFTVDQQAQVMLECPELPQMIPYIIPEFGEALSAAT